MRLALAVAAPKGSDAQPFIAALEAEGVLASPDVEVHVAEDASRPVATVPPGVDLITAQPDASIFKLWGLAVSAVSDAPYIALLDARCPVAPGWSAAMRERLKDRPAALFGPVACEWPGSSSDVVGYLVEYAQFHPPLVARLNETPGINFIAMRETIASRDVLREDGFVKTRLLAYLKKEASLPLPVGAAVVVYRKTFTFGGYCEHRYRHGRCYGADRAFSRPGTRLLAILSMPALPALRTWRIYLAARDAGMRPAFWRWLHHIVAAETAWSFGEFMGYIAGEGAARKKLV